ncbi:MAG TPA: NAD(P)/FAD-dependent oxidoreductase [Bacteroidales bacterium]|nr:NAD(P)/FAD-dependent oxidoreductase [Bacteroidales bacterium]HNS46894.1 NAD(P)/FAD-dependent oxidoreductase [Bacteroidales bacterium]
MKSFPVIIIGGGPAGAVCGIELQRAGISTCIFDKASFPRNKVCGGLLTKKTVDLLKDYCPEIGPDEYVVEVTDSVEFYYRGEPVIRFKTRIPLYLTERTVLDDRLIKLYQRLGGTVFENTTVRSHHIDLASNTINLDTGIYHYDVLVGAYGCRSLLAKLHSIELDHCFCMEGHTDKDSPEKTVKIYFGFVRGGYGWDFPKKDHTTVGTLEEEKGTRISGPFFRDIIRKEVHSIQGALIPSGRKVKLKKMRQNVLLVGDAAGYTDPVTGEGIYFAFLSAKAAADSIQKAIRTGDGRYRDIYLQNTRKIRRNIRDAYLLNKILYNPFIIRHFMNYIRRHRSFALFYVEAVVSQYNYPYRSFMWHYLRERFESGKD